MLGMRTVVCLHLSAHTIMCSTITLLGVQETRDCAVYTRNTGRNHQALFIPTTRACVVFFLLPLQHLVLLGGSSISAMLLSVRRLVLFFNLFSFCISPGTSEIKPLYFPNIPDLNFGSCALFEFRSLKTLC